MAAIQNRQHLEAYYLAHVIVGEFEAELGHLDLAAAHFRKTLALTELKSEQAFLAERLRACEQRAGD